MIKNNTSYAFVYFSDDDATLVSVHRGVKTVLKNPDIAKLVGVAVEQKLPVRDLFVVVPSDRLTVDVREVNIDLGKPRKVGYESFSRLVSRDMPIVPGRTVVGNTPIFFRIDGGAPISDPVGEIGTHITATVSALLCDDEFVEGIKNAIPTHFRNVGFLTEPALLANHLIPQEVRDAAMCLLVVAREEKTTVATVLGDGVVRLSDKLEGELARPIYVTGDEHLVDGFGEEAIIALCPLTGDVDALQSATMAHIESC